MPTIVVIEDNATNLKQVNDWLQAEGYKVIGALDGRLGMEAIHEEIPDLIICDIAMPEASGHEVLIEVRSDPLLNHIPFVFLTQLDDRESIRLSMNLGADDYLTKPVSRQEILNTVQSRLNKQEVQETQIQSLINTLNQAFSDEREKRLVKGRMIAMFSHDFRNPLALALISTGILRTYENRLSPERKKQHLDRIDGSIHLLIQMLDDMMMVAELEDSQLTYIPQPVNLTTFVEIIVEEFRLIDQGAHKLTVHSSLHNSWIQADTKILRSILANLISNALKYSPSKSEVTITVLENNDRIHLLVQDEGIGIPEDSFALLFEPFYRASNIEAVKGTGLGLSIVKMCVELHNGHIDVESELGKGTTFSLDFPLII